MALRWAVRWLPAGPWRARGRGLAEASLRVCVAGCLLKSGWMRHLHARKSGVCG